VNGTLEPQTGRVFTEITLDGPLANIYVRSSVVINANVVLATHGETKEEILGGGDASVRYQSFPLKQTPMTYVSASTPTGGQSSLQVRVNDILWTETDSLYGLPLDDRKYNVRIEDNGSTRITFNAPIPAGQENVRAKYRKGIGLSGLVKADQLTLVSRWVVLCLFATTRTLPAVLRASPRPTQRSRRMESGRRSWLRLHPREAVSSMRVALRSKILLLE
jgi:hypothetical protein